MLNGQGPYDFILDTGASATLLSPEMADHLGLSMTEEISVLGAVTASMGGRGVLKSLALGTALQQNLQVVIADIFSPLPQKIGARLDGVVGYDVLKAYRVTLNYVEQTLLLQ